MNAKKILAAALAAVLLVICSVAGTLAWLRAESSVITNTFTTSDINILLDETKLDRDGKPTNERKPEGNDNYKMVPGSEIMKDPKVTVKGGSEACYLFITVTEGPKFKDFMTYQLADGWTKLEDGVYYRQVDAATADTGFWVIKDNKLTVKGEEVTKTMLEYAKTHKDELKLEFKAYAVQSANMESVQAAWTAAQQLDSSYPAASEEEPADGEENPSEGQ